MINSSEDRCKYLVSGYKALLAEDYTEAINKLVLSISTKEVFDAIHLLGLANCKQGKFNRALSFLELATLINPSSPEVILNTGNTLYKMKKYEKSIECFENAISYGKFTDEVYVNVGNAASKILDHKKSIYSYKMALANNENCISIEILIVWELIRSGRFGEASSIINKIKEKEVSTASVVELELSCAYEQGNFLEVKELLNIASGSGTSTPFVSMIESFFNLLEGNYSAGWAQYDARLSDIVYSAGAICPSGNRWDGSRMLEKKTIFLHAEQGMGDIIQHIRFALLLQKLGAQVILEVYLPLAKLARSLSNNLYIIIRGDSVPHYDYHCPILSVASTLKLEERDFIVKKGYLQASDTDKNYWKNFINLHSSRQKIKIGVAWKGNQSNVRDSIRSIDLIKFSSLFSINADFFILQQEMTDNERKFLSNFGNVKLISSQCYDFSDTAAAISNIDLVITVDTSVAHLAGAINKPVWVLLSYVPDYRWMLHRSDSPWYSSARLFRQNNWGDWDAVLIQVAKNLSSLVVENRHDGNQLGNGDLPGAVDKTATAAEGSDWWREVQAEV